MKQTLTNDFLGLHKNVNCAFRLTFQIFKFKRHEMPKHATQNILQNNLGSKHSLLMKIGQFM